tara:strand:+ start:1238 stop:2212 length:975 start_codon:yes stop_codon:yes gene_type:complete
MELSDKWYPVINFIDENRQSTYKNKKKIFNENGEKKIFLIGDSFIQAEELLIQERFEHFLREHGFIVDAYGYSSWNTVQYKSIVESLDIRNDDHVIIFSMGNDFTPNYGRTTINTTIENENTYFIDDRSLMEKIYLNSIIINTYLRAKKNLINITKENKDNDKLHVKLSHNKLNWKDCDSIPRAEDLADKLVLNYITLSKSEECWTEDIKSSVNINIKLFYEILNIVNSNSAKLTIMLVPGGWSFKNENSLGRMHPIYLIPNNVEITNYGLYKRLEKDFNIINLEDILRPFVNDRNDNIYFPADGHWNKNAHKILGNFLIKYLS